MNDFQTRVEIPEEVYKRMHPSLIDIIEVEKNEKATSIEYIKLSKEKLETIIAYHLDYSNIYSLETGVLIKSPII